MVAGTTVSGTRPGWFPRLGDRTPGQRSLRAASGVAPLHRIFGTFHLGIGGPGADQLLALDLDLDLFRATAARTRVVNAFSFIFSPSRMSIARLTFPSRLELKRPEGSFRAAPLAKVSFATLLYVSPVQMMPSWYQVGTPLHFHSSTTSGSASLTNVRSRLSVVPRQSPSSLILASISCEGDLLFCDPVFVMLVCLPWSRSAGWGVGPPPCRCYLELR